MDQSGFLIKLFSILLCLLPILQACPQNCHCHGGDLQHVICDNVGLRRIPKVAEQTRLLNLQRNNFPVLPTNGFREMKNLVSLHLQHSHIKEISSGAFRGLKQLVYLYLSNNDISIIKMGAFDDLIELTYLYIDHNKIPDLPKGLLSPMINLFILQLSSNKLRELRAGAFHGTKDLRWLYLSNNSISSIQAAALDDVENLAIFHLDKNQLTSYPLAAMSKLRVVEDLKLSHNPMKVIPDLAFQSFGRYMETLSLENMALEKEFFKPCKYWHRELAEKELWQKELFELYRLTILKMNYILGIPVQYKCTDSATSWFSDKAFAGVTTLKTVHMENNKLSTLPGSFPFGRLETLTLSNNPWQCSCQLAPLRRWLESTRSRPDAVCASPAQARGQQIRDTAALRGCKMPTRRSRKGSRH